MNGMMSHTYSGGTIESLIINGMEVGETGMNAAIAGYHGVPLVFVSGDLAVTREAKALDPSIEVAVVKEAIGRVAAKCLHPEKARELIKAGVANAIERRDEFKPFTFQPPIILQIRFTNAKYADNAAFMPSATRLDGKTIQITQDDYIKAYHGFLTANMCAGSVA
jgi:D-amino peptidase